MAMQQEIGFSKFFICFTSEKEIAQHLNVEIIIDDNYSDIYCIY